MPGRIEFLGKHTDYAGGRSLVCATEQGFSVEAAELAESVVRIADRSSGRQAEFPLRPDLAVPRGVWSAYPATVVRRLARDFGPLGGGIEITFRSDLPQDAGLSSSSALVVATALAVIDVNRLEKRPAWVALLPDRMALAGYLGAVENGRAFGPLAADFGVGTQGGSQDHTAILCSRPGHLIQVGFDPVRLEREVPLPAGYVLVVAVSGVAAPKTREALAKYNRVAGAAAELLAQWRVCSGRSDPSLYAAVTSSADAMARLRGQLAVHPDRRQLEARLDQFAAECLDIIPAVGDALARGNPAAIGPLIDRSQAGAEAGLGNQTPETIHLQRSARRLGAVAASAFGAGYGGSVYGLVPASEAGRFRARWEGEYLTAFPERDGAAAFLTTHAAAAARRITPHTT